MQFTGNNVKQNILKHDNKKYYDINFGWIYGLNAINQDKEYVYNNAVLFEKYLKKNIHNSGHPPCSLSLYYLSQENDFNGWYDEASALKLGEKRHKSNYEIGHINELIEL